VKRGGLIALIPARGGSKGVKRKNLRIVAGKPLIAWSIETALASKCIDCVVVSTDDKEIAGVAEQFGSNVLMRPKEISGDRTPMIEVVLHALDAIDTPNGTYEHLILLQPTSPARTSDDVAGAYEQILLSGVDSIISVFADADNHPARAYTLRENRLYAYEKEPIGSLRQDLPTVYHRNGAIYLSKVEFIRRCRRLWSDSPQAYVMPKERSLNIDDDVDLLIADLLMTHWQSARSHGH
jgi:CMP-N,N'-diacetyllegionaminic acid synthase